MRGIEYKNDPFYLIPFVNERSPPSKGGKY